MSSGNLHAKIIWCLALASSKIFWEIILANEVLLFQFYSFKVGWCGVFWSGLATQLYVNVRVYIGQNMAFTYHSKYQPCLQGQLCDPPCGFDWNGKWSGFCKSCNIMTWFYDIIYSLNDVIVSHGVRCLQTALFYELPFNSIFGLSNYLWPDSSTWIRPLYLSIVEYGKRGILIPNENNLECVLLKVLK